MLSEATAFAVNPSLVCLGDVGPEAFADYNIRVLLPGSSTLGYRVELSMMFWKTVWAPETSVFPGELCQALDFQVESHQQACSTD
ncbi:hypothetical protein LEMLEM_LOCUS12920 [Lemmus lemmus]